MVSEEIFDYPNDFELETGGKLPGFQLHYTYEGQLNASSSNVIWICHALTGNSNFHEWWPGMVVDGGAFDPAEYFIICANTIGGCYGSTGPLSTNPETGAPYYHDFPEVTNRDMVRAFDLLRKHLQIPKINICVGGSLGGQHVLEWALLRPELFENLVVAASNAYHSAWGIAFNESQRMAIENDPSWASSSASAGLEGMKTARAIALLSYRNYDTYEEKQADFQTDKTKGFKASSYQRYQGEKLAKRFNAYSYWVLSQAMDSHNVGRNRGGIEAALEKILAKCLFLGIQSDVLFPMEEQVYLAANVKDAALEIISSKYGHDGFLIEAEKLTRSIKQFLGKEIQLK